MLLLSGDRRRASNEIIEAAAAARPHFYDVATRLTRSRTRRPPTCRRKICECAAAAMKFAERD